MPADKCDDIHVQSAQPHSAGKALRLAAAIALFCAFAGCGAKKPEPAAAPAYPTDQEIAEARRREKAVKNAHWRAQYLNNRPAPPEQYAILPTPPRSNDFGEFRDDNFMGLDSQPLLPMMPADSAATYPTAFNSMSPMPQAPASPAGPRGSSGFAAPAPQSARTGGRRGGDMMPATEAMIAGTRYAPIEQLVYGGEHPDLDKPELYRLMPRDIITISVKDHPEFSGQAEIQPDGTVQLPTAPDLPRLRGLTCEEAAGMLAETLRVYIKGEPKVRVQANRAKGGYYYVLGDVLQPGRFPMGMEPVKLSEAVLAANWEANPARRDMDGDELGPSFPAATPRGRFIAPQTADLARVMLVTPHRSQPSRTTHDARSALMGMTGDDPVVRPGQIIIVPSLDPARNRAMGVEPPEALRPGQGYSGANSPARLPEVTPYAPPAPSQEMQLGARESNMINAYQGNRSPAPAVTVDVPPAEEYDRKPYDKPARKRGGSGDWHMGF